MGKKTAQYDIAKTLYTYLDDHLWGCVARLKHRKGQGRVPPYSQSAPFVISRTVGSNTVVYGSVDTLLREIRLAVLDLVHENQAWAATTASNESDYTYARRTKNTLLTLAAEVRNVHDLLLHLNVGNVQCLDYDEKPLGDVPIRKVLDYLIHSRYVYIDSTHIKDIFSDRPWSHKKVQRQFMGYRISWIELINRILAFTDSVTVRDITKLLRIKLQRLQSSSDQRDLILVVQNIHALTNWIARRQSDSRYASIIQALCSPLVGDKLSALDPSEVGTALSMSFDFRGGVSIGTLKLLPDTQFRISVQARCLIRNNRGSLVYEDSDFQTYSADVGHMDFLKAVDQSFGSDSVLEPAEAFNFITEDA